ncbi:shikimate kinase [Mesobaculum littorinae]|uniref:shikimate kinase n=1 Tax=Mesobaculum littorinae TaxID=2486419 RepID=UPI002287353A|nr:shikimate kinase [Mesobaculum littorinae]
MAYRLHKTIVLVGMMGAGKTAIGGALARRLGVDFRDSDHEIERAANMTVPEIFARDGEPFFREKEARVIARLLQAEPSILSTGGGAFLAEANRTAIARHGAALWLRADLDLLWSRLRQKTTRPLLHTANPRATLAELVTRREPVYALAQLSVASAPGLSIDEMTSRVVDLLLTRPDLLTEEPA